MGVCPYLLWQIQYSLLQKVDSHYYRQLLKPDLFLEKGFPLVTVSPQSIGDFGFQLQYGWDLQKSGSVMHFQVTPHHISLSSSNLKMFRRAWNVAKAVATSTAFRVVLKPNKTYSWVHWLRKDCCCCCLVAAAEHSGKKKMSKGNWIRAYLLYSDSTNIFQIYNSK